MILHRPTLLLALIVACSASCQPLAGQPAALRPNQASTAMAGSADVQIRLGLPGMTVKTLPKTAADVASVVVTLKDSGGNTVASAGLTNPITITLPAITGTFTSVPPGTGYVIAADARDANGNSITGGTRSGNSVNIASSVATYSSGSALTLTIDLTAGTASTNSSTSTLTTAAGTTMTFDRFKWELINNVSKSAVASSLQTTTGPYVMGTVQPGATTGATHELWMFAADHTASKALPVQRFAAVANAAGTIQDPFDVSMTAVNLDTPNATSLTISGTLPLQTDNAGNVYFVTPGNFVMKRDASNSFAESPLFTPGTALTGFAVDGSGNVYYSTGNDIHKRTAPGYTSDTVMVTSTGVTQMAVDEFNDLYWIDTGSVLNYARNLAGTYVKIVDQGGLGLPLSVPGATMIAADAYGNVYTSNGTNILKRSRSAYGYWDGTASNAGPLYPSVSTAVSASNINGFAVDRVGDIYFTLTGSNQLSLVPLGGAAGTAYTVAGIGTTATPGQDGLNGDPLALANLRVTKYPAVTSKGVVFCLSTGTDDTSLFLRRIR